MDSMRSQFMDELFREIEVANFFLGSEFESHFGDALYCQMLWCLIEEIGKDR